MSWAKLRITNKGGVASRTRVELNGVDISEHCQGVRFGAQVKDVCQATLDLLVGEVEIDGDVLLRMPDEATRDLLIKHGWTPPPGEVTE